MFAEGLDEVSEQELRTKIKKLGEADAGGAGFGTHAHEVKAQARVFSQEKESADSIKLSSVHHALPAAHAANSRRKLPILIVGSTGEVGSVLVKQLSAAGQPLRLGVRSVEGKAAAAGVEFVHFDWKAPATFGRALEGVSAVVIIYPLQQGLAKDFEAFLPALKAAAVHVVRMSAAGVPAPGGPDPLNFEAGVDNGVADAQLKGSGLSYTIVAPTFFATNALRFQSYTINDHGAFYGCCGDAATAYVAIEDIASVLAACALAPQSHNGKTYTLTGSVALKESQVAQHLTVLLGKPVSYVDVPEQNFLDANVGAGVPKWVAQMGVCLEKMKALGWTAAVTSDIQQVLGRPPTSFADAIKLSSVHKVPASMQ
jgi:uncharacterized protein YbjT (DUF2867 family)